MPGRPSGPRACKMRRLSDGKKPSQLAMNFFEFFFSTGMRLALQTQYCSMAGDGPRRPPETRSYILNEKQTNKKQKKKTFFLVTSFRSLFFFFFFSFFFPRANKDSDSGGQAHSHRALGNTYFIIIIFIFFFFFFSFLFLLFRC